MFTLLPVWCFYAMTEHVNCPFVLKNSKINSIFMSFTWWKPVFLYWVFRCFMSVYINRMYLNYNSCRIVSVQLFLSSPIPSLPHQFVDNDKKIELIPSNLQESPVMNASLLSNNRLHRAEPSNKKLYKSCPLSPSVCLINLPVPGR